ncbi:hypothetical protein F5I97DRAFT_1827823 [Phlebopus sp. FC_14]|nr:hypothetical protein F5I97DRAFT_1827823 [Phlebopus sp. FC_14]
MTRSTDHARPVHTLISYVNAREWKQQKRGHQCWSTTENLWAIWDEVSAFHVETTQALYRPYIPSSTPSSIPLEGSEYSSDLIRRLEEEIVGLRMQEDVFPVILPTSQVENLLKRAENNEVMEEGSSLEGSGSGKSSGNDK